MSLNLQDLAKNMNLSLEGMLSALLTLAVCLVVTKVALKLVRRLLERSKLDQRIRKYLFSGIKTVLYLIGAIIVVGSLGIDMTSLVALLSVASLGVTLAAEDVLGNIAGGLVILSSRLFAIGDYIEASGTAGTVEEITLNHTRLVTQDGLLVMLPNKGLADSQVTNYTALGRRRVTQVVTASYDDGTEAVKAACHAALEGTPGILEDPAPAVYVTGYGESAIEYTIYCWCAAADYLDVKFTLSERLRPAFAEQGVEMTYNHLNVHIVEK
ncbi:MAG: mechanosensitive ion channel family protein [Oscillibacter sp.]|nr:mechanosensitive ion channel family protein [Oscillibacter sp.]